MGLVVPQSDKNRIILGLMTFGPDEAGGARITSMDEFKACLDAFQTAGYHEVDTARVYVGGKQEAWTRSAGWAERGLTLATKCYPMGGYSHAPAALRGALEQSLAELGARCVDIFYLHAADRSIPFEQTLAEVDALHREGKFVRLGLSNFTAFEVAEVVLLCRQHGWVRPSIYQGMYNAITRSLDAELIPCLRRYGLELVVYNPLAGGLFSGKYSADAMKTTPTDGRFSDTLPRVGKNYRDRYFKDSTFAALEIVEAAAKKHNLTLLETAFRWLVHHSALNIKHGGRDGIILGVSSQKQLDQNIKDCEKGPLPDELVQALDQAWAITKKDTPNYWHLELKYTYDTQEALFGGASQRL